MADVYAVSLALTSKLHVCNDFRLYILGGISEIAGLVCIESRVYVLALKLQTLIVNLAESRGPGVTVQPCRGLTGCLGNLVVQIVDDLE